MPRSLVQIHLHVTFSTRDRQPFLRDKALRQALHAYLVGCFKGQECPSLLVGGPEDHIHSVCRLSKNLAVAELIREVKRESSKWIKEQAPDLHAFYWQKGYGAFSMSPSHVAPLKKYIQNQEKHHRKESFQDEFRRLCKKYGAPLDERYAWD